jgi:hypothetical protein
MCADNPFSDHPDGLIRCPWPGTDPLYVAYHDEEWGVPEFDSRALFEKLILDGFQAGLSWITILRKRDAFRTAFANFDPEKIARFDAKAIAALMDNSRIIRNRAKIEGTVCPPGPGWRSRPGKVFQTFYGSSSMGDRSRTAFIRGRRFRRSQQNRWHCLKGLRNAASNSAARRSSMLFVRPPVWSMITSSRAGGMMPAPRWLTRRHARRRMRNRV